MSEDPIAMYIVVHESLNMSLGKTAVQVAHAAQRLQQKYQELLAEAESYELYDFIYNSSFEPIPKNIVDELHIFEEWLESYVRKIALKADEKEWVKLKELPNHILIIDAGYTELAPGTETIIGFWPMLKSQRPKLLKRLQKL